MTPLDRFETWLFAKSPILVAIPLLVLLLLAGMLVVVGLLSLIVVVATGGAGELVRYAVTFAVGLGAGLLVGWRADR